MTILEYLIKTSKYGYILLELRFNVDGESPGFVALVSKFFYENPILKVLISNFMRDFHYIFKYSLRTLKRHLKYIFKIYKEASNI